MADRRLVGHIPVDSAQLLLLDPVNLGTEAEYQRVVDVTLAQGAGEVWLRDSDIEVSNDGVAIETKTDGRFPVYVDYNANGEPTAIHIELT